MEAKDTVMNEEQLEPIYNKCVEDSHINNFANEVAKAQAEIPFKAGQAQECKEWLYADTTGQLGKALNQGRKEVVDWGVEDCDCGMNLLATRWQCLTCRQAKLKEWGINIPVDKEAKYVPEKGR